MPDRYPKRSQLKHTKKPTGCGTGPYTRPRCAGVANSLWFCDEAIEVWHGPTGAKPGGQWIYSDIAIETALMVRAAYGLALKQTEGFLRSVSALLDVKIRIPDHPTLSRRPSKLERIRLGAGTPEGPIHILIDSTRLKMHRGPACPGQPRNRRAWRKLHLVVDAVSAEILAPELTTHQTHDSSRVPGAIVSG